MAAYINQNSSYAYGKDREFEPHLTLNTLANPFALNAQKQAALESAYVQMYGVPSQPQVMKTNEMDPNGQRLAANRYNGENERMTDEQQKILGDLVWRGLKGMSRFYSDEKVDPRDAREGNAMRFNHADFDRAQANSLYEMSSFGRRSHVNLSHSRSSQHLIDEGADLYNIDLD